MKKIPKNMSMTGYKVKGAHAQLKGTMKSQSKPVHKRKFNKGKS